MSNRGTDSRSLARLPWSPLCVKISRRGLLPCRVDPCLQSQTHFTLLGLCKGIPLHLRMELPWATYHCALGLTEVFAKQRTLHFCMKFGVESAGCRDSASWCADYVSQDPGTCYVAGTRRLCCRSCRLQETGRQGTGVSASGIISGIHVRFFQ